jgi:hypothetical protein
VTRRFTFGLLSYICEALILIYFGLSFDKFPKSIKENTSKVIYLSMANFGVMLVMRFITVFLLIFTIKLFNRKKNLSLSFTEVSLVGFSGMIRGSIAYALVVKLADDLDPSASTLPYSVCIGQIIIAMTMYIFTPLNPMLFNTLLSDSSSNATINDSALDEKRLSLAEEKPKSNTILLQKREQLVNRSPTGFKVIFKRLDELIIKPVLIRDYENRVVAFFD